VFYFTTIFNPLFEGSIEGSLMLKGIQEKVLLVVCIMSAATIFGTAQANPMQQNFDQFSAEYQDVAKNMISSGQLHNKINPQDYTKEDINNITAKGYYGDPNAMATDSKKAYAENTNTQIHLYAATNLMRLKMIAYRLLYNGLMIL
jgi:hypothetical protein